MRSPEDSVQKEAAAYNFWDQRNAKDPFPFWKRVREAPGLLHGAEHGGFWLLSRYREVRTAATQENVFCAGQGRALPPYPEPFVPADTDGALHRQYRRILNPWMTESVAESLAEKCHAICADLLAPLSKKTEFDFCKDYTTPAILLNGLEWLGWPVEDVEKLGKWAHDLLAPPVDEDAMIESTERLTEYIAIDIDRRRHERRDDVVQAILDAEIEGRPITHQESVHLVNSLFIGAVDTTNSSLSFSLQWLAQHPEERQLLRAEPERLPLAVEEFLRLSPTIVYLARTATEDTELAGCPIKQGDRVAMLFSSANRDQNEFPNPDEVILDRTPNRHVAFGHGPHKCVGAPFARMMMRVALQEALEKLGDFQLVDESLVEWEISQVRINNRLPVSHQPR